MIGLQKSHGGIAQQSGSVFSTDSALTSPKPAAGAPSS